MLNPLYEKKETIEQVTNALKQQEPFKLLQLGEFFDEGFIKKLETMFSSPKRVEQALYGMYDEITVSEEDKQKLLSFLEPYLFGKEDFSIKGYQFSKGDYLMVGEEKHKPMIIIDITQNWPEDCGGIIGFTDGEGESNQVGAMFNSITLVTEPLFFFVSYINHYAEEGKRRILLLESKE